MKLIVVIVHNFPRFSPQRKAHFDIWNSVLKKESLNSTKIRKEFRLSKKHLISFDHIVTV